MLSRGDKHSGGAGIHAPAGLASAIRRQATQNAPVHAFCASRGRVDTSAVAKFCFSKRQPDQFPKVREMIALILNEVDHSRLLARLVRGLDVPTDASTWSSFVKQNKIKESRFMLSVLTITKSQKKRATAVAPASSVPNSGVQGPTPEGVAQPTTRTEQKELLETTNRNHMDDDAVAMLMNNCRELLFASQSFSPQLTG